jgi:hypothetical protein
MFLWTYGLEIGGLNRGGVAAGTVAVRRLSFVSLSKLSHFFFFWPRLASLASHKGGTAMSVLLICFSLNLRHRRRVPSVLDGSEIGGSRAPGQAMPSGCKKDSRIRVADEEKGLKN